MKTTECCILHISYCPLINFIFTRTHWTLHAGHGLLHVIHCPLQSTISSSAVFSVQLRPNTKHSTFVHCTLVHPKWQYVSHHIASLRLPQGNGILAQLPAPPLVSSLYYQALLFQSFPVFSPVIKPFPPNTWS